MSANLEITYEENEKHLAANRTVPIVTYKEAIYLSDRVQKSQFATLQYIRRAKIVHNRFTYSVAVTHHLTTEK